MSRTIESELHDVLMDLAPDYDLDEQGMIVAEAAAIYRHIYGSEKNRTAGRDQEGKFHEAKMMDSLLQAMGRLADWTEDLGDMSDNAGYIDATGLDATQIVNRAATMRSRNESFAPARRIANRDYFGDMSVLNDSELDVFLHPNADDDNEYDVADYETSHPADIFRVPGIGRHRSDSLSR